MTTPQPLLDAKATVAEKWAAVRPLLTKKLIAFVLIGAYAGYAFPNPESYYVADRVSVPNHVSINQVIPMEVDRSIVKPFTGEFYVNIKEVRGNRKISYCSGSGTLVYNPDMVLPETGVKANELNLGWWIGESGSEDCVKGMISTPGTYYIETCWKIDRPMTFAIVTCKNSNTFIVKDT